MLSNYMPTPSDGGERQHDPAVPLDSFLHAQFCRSAGENATHVTSLLCQNPPLRHGFDLESIAGGRLQSLGLGVSVGPRPLSIDGPPPLCSI